MNTHLIMQQSREGSSKSKDAPTVSDWSLVNKIISVRNHATLCEADFSFSCAGHGTTLAGNG